MPFDSAAHARLTEKLAHFINDKTNGDAVEGLVSLLDVSAELLKIAPDPERAAGIFVRRLQTFMRIPNRHFQKKTIRPPLTLVDS